MMDHFGISVADLDASARFYDTVLGTLGHTRLMDFGQAIGYGTGAEAGFWISGPVEGASNRECHIAFSAPDVAAVDAWFAAAEALGAEVLHRPRLWPEYHEHYYGAFVRDPDGNNVEAVCHTAEA
ncbi:VOC family protein [Propioniciclava coleopterorum]|uniref:VOC family protein n=1 Tax=Propioniciclava coleopterorum TaxID=2714937 RepID=A0A6G7Y3P3_9ACTN|nr:VOC family protein [Propioniciclava coleopterorum]QIK71296.1 VOC family protein [Propioniciclava coleopterorum]